ncbi:MAG: WD40 repeat domain-containing protein [Candidatus Hodarchaeota archaeon]
MITRIVIKDNMAKKMRFAGTLVLILSISGCLYVPPLRLITDTPQTSERDLTTIKVGITTKAEVIDLLGKPEILEEDRFCIWDAQLWYGAIMGLAIQDGGNLALDFGGKQFRVLLEFDETNVVKRCHIEGAKHGVTFLDISSPDPGGPIISSKPKILSNAQITSGQAALHRRVLFEGKDKTRFRGVAFSPDGKVVAAWDEHNRVWLCNLETGDQVILEKLGIFSSLTFSPDGKMLATVASATVRTWDSRTGNERATLDGDVRSMAFSPNGKILATGGLGGAVKLWDPAKSVETRRFNAHKSEVSSIGFSPDGKILATASSDGTVGIWDSRTGDELANINAVVSSIAFSPDGKMLATADYDEMARMQVRVWDSFTGSERAGLKVELLRSIPPFAVIKFSPDGGILAIHRGTYVELWRVPMKESKADRWDQYTGSHLANIFILPYFGPKELYPDICLAFSPDGQTIAAGCGAAVIFDVVRSRPLWRLVPSHRENDAISALAFGPDGNSLVTATNIGVYLCTLQPRE